MPIYTEDEQGIARRNPLFIFLRQVIVHTACYGKSWKKQNKRLHLATHGFMHQLQTISLLSPINIIFEKLLYNRLYTYLELNSLLSSYGFRMGLSTTLAVYDMQENILQNLEKDFITCTIFCDLSEAFDTTDHDVLLWKLDNFFGIRDLPLKLLASYLQGWQQYTVTDGCTSATLNITQGIPQGSSLGPLLFAFYINDLPSVTKLTPTLFADDTVLSIAGSNSTELQNIVNTELDKVNEWLHFNKLSLNYWKTSYMIVSRKNNKLIDLNVKINDKTITRTNCVKFRRVQK